MVPCPSKGCVINQNHALPVGPFFLFSSSWKVKSNCVFPILVLKFGEFSNNKDELLQMRLQKVLDAFVTFMDDVRKLQTLS